jgi:hypothetical protein
METRTMRSTFKVTGIELLEHPPYSGQVKLTVIFQSNGENRTAKADQGVFEAVQVSSTYTRHIQNPDSEVLKTFIDALYTKKPFYGDFTETA